MSEGKNAALIAEAREAVAAEESRHTKLAKGYPPGAEQEVWHRERAATFGLAKRALEAADTRNAELADTRNSAWVKMQESVRRMVTAEGERDAALAVIEQAASVHPQGFPNKAPCTCSVCAILATAPTGALAELKRVVAKKAWDACQKANDRFNSRAIEAERIGRPDLPGPLSTNPYRANPEPKEGE